MSRKKIVAGNWKMNLQLGEGKQLISNIIAQNSSLTDNNVVIIAPPYTQLSSAADQLIGVRNIYLAAQNCHQEEFGAFTGEISANMLKTLGVTYVILGHSERREYFGEKNELLAKKINAALLQNLKVIFCIGEPLEERENGRQNDYIKIQLQEALFHLTPDQMENLIVAYEPIWAIGTGKTATAQQAQDMHAFIRSILDKQFGTEIALKTSIIYGGSCKPSNAQEIFAGKDVDGGLIGGAALKADEFTAIIQSL